ncbi:MAG: hypothetical protein ACLGI2_04800 [Acidimicrobiia bacterium]
MRRGFLNRARAPLGLAAVFFALAVVMALPSVGQWASATPGNYGDAFFSQWLLRWNVHSLLDGNTSVFHPNIYWPARDVLVYSDSTLAAAPFAAIAAFVVGWPAAYNVLYLAGWMGALASTFALARSLRLSRPGAVLAAIVFTFAAVRVNLHGNFPMQFTFLAPLALYLLLRFLDERRWWQAVALGLSGGAVLLNIGYLAVVLFPALVVVAAGSLVVTRTRPDPRLGAGLAGAGALAAAVALPVLVRYQAQGDTVRPQYIVENAVTPRNFVSPADGSLLYGWLDDLTDSPFENRLFPGFAALAVGGVGLVALWSRDPPPELRRRHLVLVLLATLPALVLAFGKYQTVGDWRVPMPYSLVADLPGYKSVRSFGRLTVLPLLGLGLLAAVGYDRLARARPARTGLLLAVGLGGVFLLEDKARIVMSPRIDTPRFASVNRALADLPGGVVAELPMGDNRHFTYGFVEAPRMVLSAIDWNPRVNGYSGYSPPGYSDIIDVLNTLDDGGPATPEALALLDRLGVRYLVVRLAAPDRSHETLGLSHVDEAGAQRIVDALPPGRVERVDRHGEAVLIQLRPG